MTENTLAASARTALEHRLALDSIDHRPEPEQHAHQGGFERPRPDYPPSGAFGAGGHRPVLEPSGKVR